MPVKHLDAKGLLCPLPVLRARKALQTLAAGDILVLEATDRGAVKDVPAFCEAAGHTLVESIDDGGVLLFHVRKGG